MELIHADADAWKLQNEEQNRKIAAFKAVEQPTSVEHEIAVCRLLLTQSLGENSPGLAVSLAKTIAMLAKAEEQRRLRTAHYLSLADLQEIAALIGVVVTTALEHHGVDDPDILVEIGNGIAEAISRVRSDRQRTNAANALKE